MTEALRDYSTQLFEVDGIGPVLAVRLIGRCGRASRFPNADAFANYAGVAPIEVSSGERVVHRLSRSGDRKPELGSTSRRCHPGPHAQQRRASLLRPQNQRGQDPQPSNALPQTQDRITRLAPHARRRTPPIQYRQTPTTGRLTPPTRPGICGCPLAGRALLGRLPVVAAGGCKDREYRSGAVRGGKRGQIHQGDDRPYLCWPFHRAGR